jgi:hypothetical protein
MLEEEGRHMYTLGKDDLLFGGTFFIERVTELTVVTTNDKSKALHFNTIEEAETFAINNGIRLVDFTSDNTDEVTSNYFSVFC